MKDYIPSDSFVYRRIKKQNKDSKVKRISKTHPLESKGLPKEDNHIHKSEVLIVRDEYSKRELITVTQPEGYEYIDAHGVDNRTGQEIVTIIHLNGKEEQSKPFIRTVKDNESLETTEVIYLSGDLYSPSLFEKLLSSVINARLFFIISLLLIFVIPIYVFCTFGKLCYVSDEADEAQQVKVVWTSLGSYRDIATNIVTLHEADRVDVEDFGSTDFLTVVRSYPVTIKVDGLSITTNTLNETLKETLEKLDIVLGNEDIVSCDISHILTEDEEVTIQRVTYLEREAETREIPFNRVARQSPLLKKDSEIILTEGVNGQAEDYYLDRYIDDVFDSTSLIETIVLEEPISEYYLTGDPHAAASYVEGNRYTDIEIVDGKPTEYFDMIEDAICTAYSFGPNTYGASGMKMMQGFVATNPEVIPYGTLMYIASDRFTYGWAIAADCGTAMMEGYVDIDCYFETYIESVMFGKKLMDVYIVKQLTWHELEEYVANRMFYNRVPETVEES